jgi:serine/threonine protein kinase
MFAVDADNRELTSLLTGIGIQNSNHALTWYDLLGCQEDADDSTLILCWRQRRDALSRQPLSATTECERLLKQLNLALDCLGNANRRRTYDKYLGSIRKEKAIQARKARRLQRACHRVDEDLERQCSANTDSDPPTMSARARFEPLETLGSGRRGTRVFKAFDYLQGEAVVVKALPDSARDGTRDRQFLGESNLMASISHPHIVRVIEVEPVRIFRVEEFLPLTVRQIFSDLPSPRKRVSAIRIFLQQSLQALQLIHGRGIVHGQITVDSFRATETGVVKLADLPAFATSHIQPLPPTGTSRIPIPQAEGRTGETRSAAQDLYCLGLAAVDLLAGSQLQRWFPQNFVGATSNPARWQQWHRTTAGLPPLEIAMPELAPNLSEVIRQLCSGNGRSQFDSATSALAVLSAASREKTHSRAHLTDRVSSQTASASLLTRIKRVCQLGRRVA